MRTARLPKASALVAMLVCVGIFAGCGVGGEAPVQEEQGDGGRGARDQPDASEGGQEKPARAGAPETGIALGRVVAAKPDKRIVAMRSHGEEQRGERMVFRIKKNAEITLDDEKADVEAIEDDQQIRVEYVPKEKVDRALTVNLFAPREKSEGEGRGGAQGERDQEAEGGN